jgi:hypothetical protein
LGNLRLKTPLTPAMGQFHLASACCDGGFRDDLPKIPKSISSHQGSRPDRAKIWRLRRDSSGSRVENKPASICYQGAAHGKYTLANSPPQPIPPRAHTLRAKDVTQTFTQTDDRKRGAHGTIAAPLFYRMYRASRFPSRIYSRVKPRNCVKKRGSKNSEPAWLSLDQQSLIGIPLVGPRAFARLAELLRGHNVSPGVPPNDAIRRQLFDRSKQ